MNDKSRNTSTWFFLIFLVVIIIGGLLFIRDQTQFDETIAEESSSNNHELEDLELELSEKREELSNAKDELLTTQMKLTTKTEQLNTQLEKKNIEIQTLQGKVKQQNTQLGDKNTEIQTLQGKLDQKNTELGVTKTEIQTLRGESDQKDTELGNKSREIQTLRGELNQKNTELGVTKTEIQTLRGELDQKNTELGVTKTEIQTLRGESDQKDTELGNKSREIQTLRGELNQKNTELGVTKTEIQTLRGESDQKDTELGNKSREIQTLRGELNRKNTELGVTKTEIQTLRGELDQKNTELGNKSREIQTLRGELDQKDTELGNKSREIQTLRGELDQKNTELGDKSRKIQTLQGKLDKKITELDDKNRQLLIIKKTLSNSKIRSMIEKIDVLQRDQNLLNIKRRLKDFYISDYNLTHIDKEILSNYNYNSTNDEVHSLLSGDLQSKCIKLSEFGIKLLRNVNNIPKDSRKYSRVINDIVKRIKNVIDTNIQTLGDNEDVMEASATLLSMHMLIYPDKVGSTVSHYTITKSIPEIPSIKSNSYSNSYGHFDENKYKKLLNLSTPRLLTNYINNTNAYLHDINSGALYVFNSIINNDYCDHDMLDGIRQDGSAFTFHPQRNVLHIDYSYYLKDVVAQIKYPDFYASVYSELKIPGNYYDVVKKIVSILMHPKLDVVLHGLISSEGKTKLNFNWLDIKGETGCYIIPSIGFGNFKTDKFMFSLRIQMSGIPTSCLKNCDTEQQLKCNPFATSIMNIRKIHVDSSHEDYENWDAVNVEAGIIMSLKNKMYMLLDESTYVYSDCNNDYSNSNYIGQLTLENQVMFWKRDCHIKSAGDINYKITEVGVFTSLGLEAIYQIHNLGSSPLHFKWLGLFKNITYQVVDMVGCSWKDHYLIIPTDKPISCKWHMYFDEKHPVDLIFEDKKQTFNYNGHKYIIENMLDDPKSFTVKCDTDDNVILIGNNSIRVNDSVTYNNVSYYRDSRTMMYVRP